jgi:hypothetical protein
VREYEKISGGIPLKGLLHDIFRVVFGLNEYIGLKRNCFWFLIFEDAPLI